jgi:methyl-accepting chemotaxis protein
MTNKETEPKQENTRTKEKEHDRAKSFVKDGSKWKKLKNKIAKYTMLSMVISAVIMIGLAYIIIEGLSKGNFTIGQSVVFMCIAGFLVCILATLMLNGLIGRILKPIIDVAQEVKLLKEGSFLNDIKVHVDDTEIGEMVENVVAMKNSLKDVIIDITYCCTELSHGNFTVETTAEYAGDLGEIKVALSDTITILRTLVSQVGTTSEQVAVGSEQVSLGAQSVSQGTMQQASAIQQLSASIIEVSESVKNSANGAAAAEQLTNKVGDEMNVSDQNMKKMIVAMQEISNSSSEIGKIIKTIEDIAFQTNILALNAAVEAARAGAAGKGFAVVADEVRNLATKSAEAAKDTTSLIEHSIAAVENGTTIANTTAASLQAVVEGTKELITQIDLIAKEAKEEEASIREITQGIDQVSGVVQTNSATAEQSAATSEELLAQSNILKELISKFQVGETTATKDNFVGNKNSGVNKNSVNQIELLDKKPDFVEPVQIEAMIDREETKPVIKEKTVYTPSPIPNRDSVSKSVTIATPVAASKPVTASKPVAASKPVTAFQREIPQTPKPRVSAKAPLTPVSNTKAKPDNFESTNGKTINDHSDKY